MHERTGPTRLPASTPGPAVPAALSEMPGTERIDGTRLELTLPDMITAHRAFRALMLMTRD